MRAASIPMRLPGTPLRSKRLLSLADDTRLVEQIRRGNEAAFEVAFERHGAAILGFCRHMLGSTEEAEDAVQHTFAAAFRDLTREDRRDIALRPWLYAIARNRCVSMLRTRREQPAQIPDMPTAGLADEVQNRADLRELVADLRDLPEEQRSALLLAELGDLSHAEVAGVLGCEVPKVKALVFRARSGLIARREARETSCEEIREQLANLSGGSLRRRELKHHLAGCPGCRDYREQVKRQRQMLAVALPVVPGLGLKKSVLAAVGFGGGAAGGGGAAAGLGGAGALFSSLGAATATKVAVVGAVAATGAVSGAAVVDQVAGRDHRVAAFERVTAQAVAAEARADAAAADKPMAAPGRANSDAARERREAAAGRGEQISAERRAGARGIEQSAGHSKGRHRALAKGIKERAARRRTARGQQRRERLTKLPKERGRGPVEAPAPQTPVKRGPATPRTPPAPRAEKPEPTLDPTIEVAPTPASPPAPKGPAVDRLTGPEK